jgi:hypothetical protein
MRSRESIDDSKKKKSRKYIQQYDKDNFSMYNTWVIEFNNTHTMVLGYLEENKHDYYQILEKKFFNWLNEDKNILKFMFEIKKEFMIIADKVLLHEIMDYQLKISQYIFVIGPFQKYLEFIGNNDIPIDGDIDMFSDSDPDIEPDYSLLETNYVEECIVDDDYYLSFFK